MTRTSDLLLRRLVAVGHRDRGDVPGWVLITVMTAGIVAAIYTFAKPALLDLFTTAINSVTGR
ncbi:MAG: hypothetical protein M3Y71_11525 [Actinomycetota bacterium]|nr:hypothetical protein [Actinomycetota bacterium]